MPRKNKLDGEGKLVMKFDPQTIEHLGLKMYSNISKALAELVANAYDADAKNVYINLYDESSNQRIEVADDGEGMTFDDINDQFLRIGRNRRREGFIKSPSGKRKATGKKGLGKLAFFGIGKTIVIETIRKNSGWLTHFTLDWKAILSTHSKDYNPSYIKTKCDKKLRGTTVKVFKLNRKPDFDKEELAIELSKLFNFVRNDFKVYITLNNDKPFLIHNKLKYKNLDKEFEWKFPAVTTRIKAKYTLKKKIKGKIISTKKPLKPGLRGISLFANGRLVNAPEFFGASESSHGYFIDDLKEDVIATDRQTLNWNFTSTSALREFLKKCMTFLEKDWHDKRNEARQKKIKKVTKVDLVQWYKHLPKEVLESVQPIINAVLGKYSLPEEDGTTSTVVQKLNILVPEYPYYHWRHLHPIIQAAAKADYEKKDYYGAFIEAAKRYITTTRKKSGSRNSDRGMMGEVFGSGKLLLVTKNFKRPDGTDFNQDTYDDIEEGQKFLSMGIVAGGRNPVSHEEIKDLRDSGLFSEKDCLDGLSLLSHLLKRLEGA